MCGLELPADPRLLRGLEGSEDAGVFLLDDDRALVQTVDVLTPIVDDPFTFGRIAAVNALSDVYAMGGRPLTALNIVAFPIKDLGVPVLRRIIEGGISALKEAGAVLVGGHSIKDEEPKYGLAVTGLVDPKRMITNDALRPGQRLLLSKPIGTGVVSTADKRSLATPEQTAAMVASMARLNRQASERAVARGVRAGTDVTGFGLAGHLVEMARASRCAVRLRAPAVPLLPGALEHAEADRFPGGSRANRSFFSRWTKSSADLPEALLGLMFDAQTSGGLLLGVEPADAQALLDDLLETGHTAAVIGEVVGESPDGELILVSERG